MQDVIRLETQYWSLVEIPKQEKAETVPAFVLRACAIMEKTQKSGEGVKTSSKLAEEAAEKRERIERLNGNFISLQSEYVSSKLYPMFPRYTMLKDMIKDIMHDPDYMEVCHEVDP
ncbi:jg13109 [Pararge aegeria aegeria]|uniref:Jg13109 protein n=1 Tax=Pararge aegeria aegeria TaxID=348720 RepID=A0A8S4R929_9NEOP|nr:jg13109 [Pararge aegeria aegeria]